jgi:hypothetical protein
MARGAWGGASAAPCTTRSVLQVEYSRWNVRKTDGPRPHSRRHAARQQYGRLVTTSSDRHLALEPGLLRTTSAKSAQHMPLRLSRQPSLARLGSVREKHNNSVHQHAEVAATGHRVQAAEPGQPASRRWLPQRSPGTTEPAQGAAWRTLSAGDSSDQLPRLPRDPADPRGAGRQHPLRAYASSLQA